MNLTRNGLVQVSGFGANSNSTSLLRAVVIPFLEHDVTWAHVTHVPGPYGP